MQHQSPEKSHPPPSKNKSCQAPFFETLVGGSTPPSPAAERGGGCILCVAVTNSCATDLKAATCLQNLSQRQNWVSFKTNNEIQL